MSTSTTPSLKTIALFGATGGTGLSILKHCLAGGHTVNVLARTPSKLSSLSTQYPTTLHIIQGDIYSLPSVKSTLLTPPGDNGSIVDMAISSIGMVIQMQGLKWTSRDPNVCESGMKMILAALAELETEMGKGKGKGVEEEMGMGMGGTRIVALSTTGISDKGRDIKLAMVPMYHWMLGTPHADKKRMEEVLVESGRRWVAVRPSFLLDGVEKGVGKVRVGVEVPGEERNEVERKEVGYVIHREDVGGWIFEECVKGDSAKWEGKMVSLTY